MTVVTGAGSVSGGNVTGGTPWQAFVPSSVNVLPASGTNCQS